MQHPGREVLCRSFPLSIVTASGLPIERERIIADGAEGFKRSELSVWSLVVESFWAIGQALFLKHSSWRVT
jgi:hypothetical protein